MDEERININTASCDDLQELIGIGQAKADAIVNMREASGGFNSISDLLKVPGIGAGVLDQNRLKLTCKTSQPSPKSGNSNTSTSNKRETAEHDKPSTSQSTENTQQIMTRSNIDTSNNLSKVADIMDSSSVSNVQPQVTTESVVGSNLLTRSRAARIKFQTSDDNIQQNNEQNNKRSSLSSSNGDSQPQNTAIVNSNNDSPQGTVSTIVSETENTEKKENISQSNKPSCDVPSCSYSNPDSENSPAVQGCIDTDDSNIPTHIEVDDEVHINYRNVKLSNTELNVNCDDDDVTESEEDGETFENDDDDVLDDITDDDEDDVGIHDLLTRDTSPGHSLRSKLLMKRKSEDGALVDKAVSPEKKPCFDQNSSLILGSALRPSIRLVARQRVPSKTNPPTGMADWIQTFKSWSNAERMVALDDLVEHCEPTQVRHLMAVIEPQFQRDFISLLPKELALYVLSFLEPKSLLNAAQTCQYWRVLAEDNLLWREKCREEKIDESLVFGNKLRRKVPASLRRPWKHLYMRQHQIEKNWRSGPVRPTKVLKGHDDHVITCLEFSGNRIVSGSDDNTLKVWSTITGKCLRTLTGHTGGVWSSQMRDHLVISGSTDRTIKIWNADTGDCLHTLYGHSSTVRCMHLHNNRVVSGSRDAMLRMWDIDTGECLHVYMGHVAAVRCVQYDGERVISGAYDYMVKIWDPETETCLHTLQGHTNRVYSLQFDGSHIVSGSLDTSIRVWDVNTGNCLHTLVGHQSLTSGMELKDNILVSGNADSTVKVWDITTGQCLQTLQGPNKHQSAVTCLQFNKKFVITSSDDGTVKIWDLRTGEFIVNLVTLESGGSGGVVWRIRCCNTKLVCAVGSRNGTEETKLMVLDFDVQDDKKREPSITTTVV